MAARKYQWEDWFGRRRTVLVRGVDYHCSQSTMVQTIRNKASQLGIKVSVMEDEDCQAIQIEVRGEVHHPDKAVVAG